MARLRIGGGLTTCMCRWANGGIRPPCMICGRPWTPRWRASRWRYPAQPLSDVQLRNELRKTKDKSDVQEHCPRTLTTPALGISACLFGGPLLMAWLGVASGQAAPAASIMASPTFTHDVAPILFQHCANCHHEGEVAPFPLLTYAGPRHLHDF